MSWRGRQLKRQQIRAGGFIFSRCFAARAPAGKTAILRRLTGNTYFRYTDLIASWWFFRYGYLYTVMITTFFWGRGWELGNLGRGGEGKRLPLKYPRLDRTLGGRILFRWEFLQQNSHIWIKSTCIKWSPSIKLTYQILVTLSEVPTSFLFIYLFIFFTFTVTWPRNSLPVRK